ncbi:MAG: M28 family peptidase [Candidatus Bathyarchaeota archaeon]|nr:M28 family peptidase [Candidatus Bathyarchaeota archaeon]
MILLPEEDRKLLRKMEAEVSKATMIANFDELMQYPPLHSGSAEEEQAIQVLRKKLEEYGLEPKILRYEAYITDPKTAKLTVTAPQVMEVQTTPYRQAGSTSQEGFEAEVIYVPPDMIGYQECRGKIVLCEQKTSGDWMGLQGKLLLKLQDMGALGLIVIEQDDFMPTVCHQRADFSVSGNPTSDNLHLIPKIPAILHVSHRDGAKLRKIAQLGGMRSHIISFSETRWKRLPLLVTEIKGRKEPDKFVLVNGHVDTPPYCLGATDNISGDTAILEVARILNKHKEKLHRSVRIAYWTGHEIGKYAGSTWYNDTLWHDLRYNCVASYNIDSPGVQGATTVREAPYSEVLDAVLESVKDATGITVEHYRWPTRAGDGSFWGTGLPHVSVTTSRPKETYDPHVNYSGGGWWWHTPYETHDKMDIDILVTDVKIELNLIWRLANCPILPFNYIQYAERMIKILEDLQAKSEKISSFYNLYPLIDEAKELRVLSEKLEIAVKKVAKEGDPTKVEKLNRCLMWAGRHVNPIAHSDHDIANQVSMETFGAQPFPRISQIVDLAEMTLHQSPEFKFLYTKLVRERNLVEDGFFQANELIKATLEKL